MTDPRVEEALAAVPRASFLRHGDQRFVELDMPLPIGHGQSNSQPTTVRHQLDLLEVSPGDRVLDVGCGSGWTTALLAHLVGPDGMVVGVEILPDLVEFGLANLRRFDFPWARIEPARPGELGRPDLAPFDRILVSAEAPAVPDELVDQLRVDGLMVIPVRGRLWTVRRTAGWPQTKAEVLRHGHYAFVPLVEPEDQ